MVVVNSSRPRWLGDAGGCFSLLVGGLRSGYGVLKYLAHAAVWAPTGVWGVGGSRWEPTWADGMMGLAAFS